MSQSQNSFNCPGHQSAENRLRNLENLRLGTWTQLDSGAETSTNHIRVINTNRAVPEDDEILTAGKYHGLKII